MLLACFGVSGTGCKFPLLYWKEKVPSTRRVMCLMGFLPKKCCQVFLYVLNSRRAFCWRVDYECQLSLHYLPKLVKSLFLCLVAYVNLLLLLPLSCIFPLFGKGHEFQFFRFRVKVNFWKSDWFGSFRYLLRIFICSWHTRIFAWLVGSFTSI